MKKPRYKTYNGSQSLLSLVPKTLKLIASPLKNQTFLLVLKKKKKKKKFGLPITSCVESVNYALVILDLKAAPKVKNIVFVSDNFFCYSHL